MSTTKTHTPGTWQVVEDRDNGTDYYWITTKELLRHNPVDHEWAITNKADAYLIAASPAMAEALDRAIGMLASISDMIRRDDPGIDEADDIDRLLPILHAARALSRGEKPE